MRNSLNSYDRNRLGVWNDVQVINQTGEMYD
jgi:hypothetical protein